MHFTWCADQFPDHHFGTAVNVRLIAQDVEHVFPERVSSDERGFKMVNYTDLPYLTLAAVKELHARSQAKDDRIRALEARVEALEKLVASSVKR